MLRAVQGQIAHTFDLQHEWTMLGEGPQVPEWRSEGWVPCLMKMHAEHCRRAEILSDPGQNTEGNERTPRRPRNKLTRLHSSPLSLSPRILSRFIESVSSHRNSSTKLSTCCQVQSVTLTIAGSKDIRLCCVLRGQA
jgi:hypothetical protein